MENISLNLSDRKSLLLVIDLLLIVTSTLFGLWIHAEGLAHLTFDLPYLVDQIEWLLFLPSVWIFSIYLSGLYDMSKSTDISRSLLLLIQSGMIVLGIYLLIFFYTAPINLLPRGIVVYQILAGIALLLLWRALYITVLGSPRFSRKVLIIGAGWAGQTIAKAFLEHAAGQYFVIGFIDDDPEKRDQKIEIKYSARDERITSLKRLGKPGDERHSTVQIPVVGSSSELDNIVVRYQVPELVLAITNNIQPGMFRALIDCKEKGLDISLMTERYEDLTGRVPVEHIGDNWVVSLPLDSVETSLFYALGSRLFDFFGALFGLIVLIPFFPIIALLIYVDSPGPIFYSQTRTGKGGKEFTIYKLRTMIPNAEIGTGAHRASEEDPRITRVGRWLRKFRLDEMPQLYNILKGEMSAVGPRPERPEHLAELEKKVPYHRLRNSVKPGMAGWAVVNYGYVDDLESGAIRLQYDLYYVKHQSLWLDLIILLRTFGQILMLRGR